MVMRTDKISGLPEFAMPIVIPIFNNLTYLSNTIDSLTAKGFVEYLILNNGSQYPPLEEYLGKLPDSVTVLDLLHNPGPRVYFENQELYAKLPEQFILTDPDLGFTAELDKEAILHLFELGEKHRRYKVGCALDISIREPNILDLPAMFQGHTTTIRALEESYYRHFVGTSKYGDAIFNAPIDTTFAAYTKRYFVGNTFAANYRVAGRYTATHYGWCEVPPMPAAEYAFYKHSVATSDLKCSSTESVRTRSNWTY